MSNSHLSEIVQHDQRMRGSSVSDMHKRGSSLSPAVLAATLERKRRHSVSRTSSTSSMNDGDDSKKHRRSHKSSKGSSKDSKRRHRRGAERFEPIGHGWYEGFDSRERKYYIHKKRGITQWELPTELTEAPPPLPEGWVELKDAKGRPYYGNAQLRRSQRARPGLHDEKLLEKIAPPAPPAPPVPVVSEPVDIPPPEQPPVPEAPPAPVAPPAPEAPPAPPKPEAESKPESESKHSHKDRSLSSVSKKKNKSKLALYSERVEDDSPRKAEVPPPDTTPPVTPVTPAVMGESKEESKKEKKSKPVAIELPPGWQQATDAKTGKMYFFNNEKGLRQWSLPTTETLPDGWEEHLDSSSGKHYFVHRPTKRVQWTRPES